MRMVSGFLRNPDIRSGNPASASVYTRQIASLSRATKFPEASSAYG